jgi:hypothetical protein
MNGTVRNVVATGFSLLQPFAQASGESEVMVEEEDAW